MEKILMSFLKFCSFGAAVLAVGSGSCCLQAADHVREPNDVAVMNKTWVFWCAEWDKKTPQQLVGKQNNTVL
jgi:hypothetical protein